MKASVIGTGFGLKVVARAYAEVGFEVDVVSPRDAEAVARACANPVDLVSIHSPPALHQDHVLLALSHGRNVLCDKPFGTSEAEAKKMLDAATAAGVLHFVNFEFRRDPARQKLKSLIDEGAIGAPHHANWSMLAAFTRTPLRPYGWLFDAARGGGWIGAYGSHVVDALRWLLGEIVDVAGMRRIDLPQRPDSEGRNIACTAEDAFTVTLRFGNGAAAVINSGCAFAVDRPQTVEIFGSEGALTLIGNTQVKLQKPGQDAQIFKVEPSDSNELYAASKSWALVLRDALRDKQQISPSFADGAACAKVLDALRSLPIASPSS